MKVRDYLVRRTRRDRELFPVNSQLTIGISSWDLGESAETYTRTTYAEVLKALAKAVEGTPEVKTFEVGNSTFHRIAARAAGT